MKFCRVTPNWPADLLVKVHMRPAIQLGELGDWPGCPAHKLGPGINWIHQDLWIVLNIYCHVYITRDMDGSHMSLSIT